MITTTVSQRRLSAGMHVMLPVVRWKRQVKCAKAMAKMLHTRMATHVITSVAI